MNLYYLNNKAQSNGDHEVHKMGCNFMPADRKYLGFFSNCVDAVKEAKKTYSKSNGCFWCSKECHTT